MEEIWKVFIVYKIQTILRLLFINSTNFKVFATRDDKIFRRAAPAGQPIKIPAKKTLPDVVEIEQKCPSCGLKHQIYGKFSPNPQIDKDLKKKGFTPFPKNGKINCNCGFEIDLLGVKNKIETQTGKKILPS